MCNNAVCSLPTTLHSPCVLFTIQCHNLPQRQVRYNVILRHFMTLSQEKELSGNCEKRHKTT